MPQSVTPQALSWEPVGVLHSLRRTIEVLLQANHVVVIAHANPDGDAISSTLAVGHLLDLLGIRNSLVNSDPVPSGLKHLHGAARVVFPHQVEQSPDVVVALDCGEPHRLGDNVPAVWLQGTLIVLDHHDKWSFPDHTVAVRDPDAACTGELVYRMVVESGLRLDPEMARLLLTALYFDTGSFRYGCTTSGTMELAAALYRTGVDAWALTSLIYENLPLARVRLQGEALRGLRLSTCGRLAGFVISDDMLTRAGATSDACDGLVNQARAIAGVEIAWQVHREEGRVHLAVRSRGNLDVRPIALALGIKSSTFAANGWFDADEEVVAEGVESGFAMVYGSP
jgi:phosphoesterase RecJ-like protein